MKDEEKLRSKIESQKGSGRDFRPGTRLDPATGNEQSRTGKTTDRRDVQPGAQPEEEQGQNAIGGKTSR